MSNVIKFPIHNELSIPFEEGGTVVSVWQTVFEAKRFDAYQMSHFTEENVDTFYVFVDNRKVVLSILKGERKID